MTKPTEQIFRKYEAICDEEIKKDSHLFLEHGFVAVMRCLRDLESAIGSFTPRLEWGFQIEKIYNGFTIKLNLFIIEYFRIDEPIYFFGHSKVFDASGVLVEQHNIGGLVTDILGQGLASYVLKKYDATKIMVDKFL